MSTVRHEGRFYKYKFIGAIFVNKVFIGIIRVIFLIFKLHLMIK